MRLGISTLSVLVERRWCPYFLSPQQAQVFTTLLTLDGNQGIAIANVAYYFNA
jgi:hypothetical protein